MLLKKIIERLDKFQYQNKIASFIYAVIAKYSQDNSGYMSALIAYYSFISLLPLMIVLTSLAKLIFRNDTSLRYTLSLGIAKYFPVVGEQIQHGVHDPGKTGVLLIVSLLLTLYGSRGIASALQFSLSNVWQIPKHKRPPFIQNLSRSISIIVLGGMGLIAAALISGYVIHIGPFPGLKVIGTVFSLLIIWLTLIGVFKLAIAGNKKVLEVWRGAALAAFAIQVLQLVGNIILAHELKNLDSRYGVFGLVIGLLFWLYLLAQVIMYCAQVDAVRYYHLYPRRIKEPVKS